MEGGAIAGLVVGLVLVAAAVVLLILLIISFRKWRRHDLQHEVSKENKLNSIFRTIDNKLTRDRASKATVQNISSKFDASSATTEVHIEMCSDGENANGSLKDKSHGEDNLGLDVPESPIRKSANTYSEIDLGDT